MSRVTHVVVFGVDDDGNQADWLMPLEEFAKLFTYGPMMHMGPKGAIERMSHNIYVRSAETGSDTKP